LDVEVHQRPEESADPDQRSDDQTDSNLDLAGRDDLREQSV
jgi:hypothetical protein